MTTQERAAALADIEALIAVSEREYIGDVCLDEPDDEPVAAGVDRSSEITFGHVRRARAALRRLAEQYAPSPAPADLREVVADPPGRRVVSLGHGKYAISTGTYYDVPAVFIEDAPSPGPTGGNVPPEEREKIGYSAENAVIFTHQDNNRVQVIANLMCGDSFDAAISTAGYVIVPCEPTPVMLQAAWRAFRGDRKGPLLAGAGPAFKEAIRAALAAEDISPCP